MYCHLKIKIFSFLLKSVKNSDSKHYHKVAIVNILTKFNDNNNNNNYKN